MIERRNENSEYYHNMLMDASPNLIIITDATTMHSANKTLLDFVGFDSIEAFKKHHACICDLFEAHNDHALLKQMGAQTWIEYILEHPKKNIAYLKKAEALYAFSVHANALSIEGKNFYAIIFNDITELEMQKERYTQAIEGSQVGLWDWDIASDTVYFSPEWKSMLGYEDHELPNAFETWQERIHPEDLDSALKALQDNIKGESSFYHCTHRLKHKDGHWVWIDARGKTFFDSEGKPKRMVGVHNDITLIKESEALNAKYAARAQALLQLPPLNEQLSEADFMRHCLELVEDLTQSVVSFIHFINDDEKSVELVTWSHRTLETYCHAVHDTHYPISQAGIWVNALHTKQPFVVNDYATFEDKKGLPQGHATLIRFISMPVIEDGKVVMLCDIGNKPFDYTPENVETLELIASETWRLIQRKRTRTKLKETQEMLLAQSRNAAMGEMISMIAHQWRQPISIIGMCVNNMLLDMELETIDPKEFEKQLHDILTQTEHLSQTIDDFRNFLKPGKSKESVSVQVVVEDALKLMQKSFDASLIFVSCMFTSDTPLMLHRRELMQVFLNIFKNAKEAFENRALAECFIHIEVSQTPTSVITSICDNAGGIEPDALNKIFEPYFSTKHDKNGTGLGLYMSKIIIEKHLLGEIRAYNKDDGACFEIVLPKET